MKKCTALVIILCLCGVMVLNRAPEAARAEVNYTWLNTLTYEAGEAPVTLNAAHEKPGEMIQVGGICYTNGISTHPMDAGPADITFNVEGMNAASFAAWVGPDGTWANQFTSVEFILLADGEVKVQSGVLREGECKLLACDITGAKKITLRVTDGGDGRNTDASSWALPCISRGDVSSTETMLTEMKNNSECLLSMLTPLSYECNGGEPSYNTAYTKPDEKINVAGHTFYYGISVHPRNEGPAVLTYDISKLQYTTFSALVGPDGTWANVATSVVFEIWVDGELKASSDVLRQGNYAILSADITGASALELRVTDGGDGINTDASSWALPYMSCGTCKNAEAALNRLLYVQQSENAANQERLFLSDAAWSMMGGHNITEDPEAPPVYAMRDKNIMGEDLVIGDRKFEKGIGMHASISEGGTYIEIYIEGLGFSTFASYVGISRSDNIDGEHPSVTFVVYADGTEVARSREMKYEDEPLLLTADITGCSVLRIEANSGEEEHSDWAAWGNAVIAKNDSLGDLFEEFKKDTPTTNPSEENKTPDSGEATKTPGVNTGDNPVTGDSSYYIMLCAAIGMIALPVIFITAKGKKREG